MHHGTLASDGGPKASLSLKMYSPAQWGYVAG